MNINEASSPLGLPAPNVVFLRCQTMRQVQRALSNQLHAIQTRPGLDDRDGGAFLGGGPPEEASVFVSDFGEGDDERVEGFALIGGDGFFPAVDEELDECWKVCRGRDAGFVLEEVCGGGDGVLQQVALDEGGAGRGGAAAGRDEGDGRG